MNRYTVELATSILHLEMQKEKILKDNNSNLILCHCRTRILKNYINVCQLFLIRLTAKIIKFLEDNNVSKTLITSDLKTWYITEMYDKLYNKQCISNKMVLLFKLLQDRSDKEFFNKFDENFRYLIKIYKEEENIEFEKRFKSLYSDLLDWMESHILSILSLKIDCTKISNKILDDLRPYIQRIKLRNNIKSCCDLSCEEFDCFMEDCPSQDFFRNNEEIHLYVSNEILERDTWILEYFDLLNKYHSNLKEVSLILDYIIFDEISPLVFTEKNIFRLKYLQKLFKDIKIINYKYVDFNKWYEEVKPFLSEENK